MATTWRYSLEMSWRYEGNFRNWAKPSPAQPSPNIGTYMQYYIAEYSARYLIYKVSREIVT